MSFSSNLINDFNNINSKYDLIAYCYQYLLKNIENQNVFVGDYIATNGEQTDNPNFQSLCSFALDVKKIFETNSICILFNDRVKEEILHLVISVENALKNYGEISMNLATVPFFMIKGLDLFFQDCTYETSKISPLNECCKDICFIYLMVHYLLWMR